MVAVPIDQSVDILEKSKILTKRNNTLLKVKQYIDKFLDRSKASYADNLTVNEALKFLNNPKVDYYDTLLPSTTSKLLYPFHNKFYYDYSISVMKFSHKETSHRFSKFIALNLVSMVGFVFILMLSFSFQGKILHIVFVSKVRLSKLEKPL